MTREDIDRLLILQKKTRNFLGKILVLYGAISKEDMEEELRQFNETVGRKEKAHKKGKEEKTDVHNCSG
ncbi:MAG: hypothetical protein MAG551_00771 [Candidatus Scalindua arabica]|uniref:Uncharacterized protein n=1 Tax=Candidatus Scalindua arabica TaxID=1127984 RepID=A0A941W3A3_9BACT|nr:hypothetical protein [Candidatus Scalindua arabica]